MKENNMRGYAVLVVLFVSVSMAALVVPVPKTLAFWMSYVGFIVALVMQVIVWKTAFGRGNSMKSTFLGLPVVHIGTVYLVLQIIVLGVFAFVPGLPEWAAILATVALAAIAGVCLISADAARDEIERVEDHVGGKVAFLKSLQADAELLARTEADAEVKEQLENLAWKIRFSDPMSPCGLEELDGQIARQVAALKDASLTSEQKDQAIKDISELLDERNATCKILK